MLLTNKGFYLDYSNPNPKMIDIDDILTSLVRTNRYLGHTSYAYNVGLHSFYCLVMAQKLGYSVREQLLTFVHDFTEAYVGDCPSPLKRLIPEFAVIEERIEMAIYKYIGIEPPTEEEYLKIKRVDLTMLVIEMKKITVHDWENYIDDHTYTQMIYDEDFDLETMPERELHILLRVIYKQLLIELKEENANA